MSFFLAVATLDRLSTVVNKVTTLSTSCALEAVAIINHVATLTTVFTNLGGTVLINMPTKPTTTAADFRTLGNLMTFLLAIAADQRPRFLGAGASRLGVVSRLGTAILRLIGRVGLLSRSRHSEAGYKTSQYSLNQFFEVRDVRCGVLVFLLGLDNGDIWY